MASENSFFSGFPSLQIDQEDIFGSWETFLNQFEIELEMKEILCGTKTVVVEDGPDVVSNVFDDRMKRLAFLKAIGVEGQRLIKSKGHNVLTNTLTYPQAKAILVDFYGREESINVKTRNFVSVNQRTAENKRDYLKRVEQLSRNLTFFNSETDNIHEALQTARENLALVIAVNGLSDHKLRKELMCKRNLTWQMLSDILATRVVAEDSADKLEQNIDHPNLLPIKQEISEIRDSYKQGNYRDRPRSDSRDRPQHRQDYQSQRNYRNYSRDRPQNSRGYRNQGGDNGRGREESRSRTRDRDPPPSYNSYRRTPSRDRQSPRNCFSCGSSDHMVRDCRDAKCYSCGEKGHTSPDCRRNSRGNGRGNGEREWRSSNYREGDRNSRDQNPSQVEDPKSEKFQPLRSRESSPYPNRDNSPSHYIRQVDSSQND